MGQCLSNSPEAEHSRTIDRSLRTERQCSRIIKLLLLGPGESGKSTIFKQARIIYANGFNTEDERKQYIEPIHANMLEGVKRLIDLAERSSTFISPELQDIAIRILRLPLTQRLTPEIGQQLFRLWQDENFKNLRWKTISTVNNGNNNNNGSGSNEHSKNGGYSQQMQQNSTTRNQNDNNNHNNNNFDERENNNNNGGGGGGVVKMLPHHTQHQEHSGSSTVVTASSIGDATAYLLDRILEICREDYIPTVEDIVRCRVRTSGIVEQDIAIKSVYFRFVDVGGQRGERRKWIHCFDNVQAVAYVAAISEYDQVLLEDNSTNRIIETLQLFSTVINLDEFCETPFLVFLNKSDVFQEKLSRRQGNLRDVFPDYTGGYDFETAIKYLVTKFRALQKKNERELYFHVTNATSKSNMSFVFNAVYDIVIRENLRVCDLS